MSMVDTDERAGTAELHGPWEPEDDGLGACRGAFWALVIELAVLGPLALAAGWLW